MSEKVKSSLYSPVSLEAIEIIAKLPKKNPRLLMAYIILARFAGQKPVGNYGPNRVTGAGANAVASTLKIGWERGNELVKALVKLKVITPAPKGLLVGSSPATYVLCHAGDLDIPHALASGLGDVPGIARLLDKRYGESMSSDVVVTALVILAHCYRNHDMLRWGGVDSELLYQKWTIHAVTAEEDGFKVKARRSGSAWRYTSFSFYRDVMQSLGVSVSDPGAWKQRFSEALSLLTESGLWYEAVTLVDKELRPIMPVRINDLHAARAESEPSCIEQIPGGCFYTRVENPLGDPEGVWLLVPEDPEEAGYAFVGVTRLRFRCATAPTAMGLARDLEAIQKLKARLIELDLIEDLDFVE